ncbi:hypothetical protein KQI65_00140 [bacterium]|nr:hypothetical protein [bacterium]
MLLPMIGYVVLLQHYGVNIPALDDYDTILAHVVSDRADLSGWIAQFNEHRVAWIRLSASGYYHLFGEINFEHLMYFGNLALLLLFLLLLKMYRSLKYPIMFFVPVAYLLFQPQSWRNMIWAMASLQNFWVLLFVLLSLLLWSRGKTWSYLVAAVFAVMAAFTGGNGILVFVVLLIWELFRIAGNLKSRRYVNWKLGVRENLHLGILIIAAASAAYLYLDGYQTPGHAPDLVAALLNPVLVMKTAGILAGSYLKFLDHRLVLAVGVAEALFFAFLTWKGYMRRNPVAYYFLLFLFLTMLLIGLSRSGWGEHQALIPRYRIFAIVALIMLYLAFIEYAGPWLRSRKNLVWVIVSLALLFNLGSIHMSLPSMRIMKTRLTHGLSEWKQTGTGLYHGIPPFANRLMEEAIKKGIYHPPEKLAD